VNTDLMLNSTLNHNDYYDNSFYFDRMEKQKYRWQKVLENKDKMSYGKKVVEVTREEKQKKKEKDKYKKKEENDEENVRTV
jgi:hypothetical protein